MDFFQNQKNAELGEQIRLARKRAKLTQSDIQAQIGYYYCHRYESYLKEKNFTNADIDTYFATDFEELDESLQKRLLNIGISEAPPSQIALSTISHYENGVTEIPAWYIELMKELLGDIEV